MRIPAVRPKPFAGVVIGLVVVAALAFAFSTWLFPSRHQTIQEQTERSMAIVVTTWHVPNPTYPWLTLQAQVQCSGFFARSDGTMVTAGHCVDPGTAQIKNDLDNQYRDQAVKQQGGDSSDVMVPDIPVTDFNRTVEVVQPDVPGAVIHRFTAAQVLFFRSYEGGDDAILKVNGLHDATPALTIASAAPQVGDPVTAIGFSSDLINEGATDSSYHPDVNGNSVPTTLKDRIDSAQPRASYLSGSVSSQQVLRGVPTTEITASVVSGMPGGPTVNASGQVIGINHTETGSSMPNLITDEGTLRNDLAGQHGRMWFEWVSGPGFRSHLGAIILLLVAAALVVLLGSRLLYRTSRSLARLGRVATATLRLRRQRHPASTAPADQPAGKSEGEVLSMRDRAPHAPNFRG